MADIAKKNFSTPDEIQNPGEKLKVEVVTVDGLKFQKVTAAPGWQWSKHLKSVAGTESCEKHHLVYVISGKLHARMNDGSDVELNSGEIGVIPPGHDGWNAGNEPVAWLEIPH